MAESQRMIIDNIGEKLIFMSTQRYDVTYGNFGRRFFETLSVEFDGVRALKWNYERVIIF